MIGIKKWNCWPFGWVVEGNNRKVRSVRDWWRWKIIWQDGWRISGWDIDVIPRHTWWLDQRLLIKAQAVADQFSECSSKDARRPVSRSDCQLERREEKPALTMCLRQRSYARGLWAGSVREKNPNLWCSAIIMGALCWSSLIQHIGAWLCGVAVLMATAVVVLQYYLSSLYY